MNEQQVKDLIEAFIVANGNNEITADVLRPILLAMLAQPNDEIGDLSTLNTTTQVNLVDAINELYNTNTNQGGVKLHEGTDNPNDVPPTSYEIADFYIEKDLSDNPIQLWQFNGVEWVKANGNYLTSSAYPDTKYNYTSSNNFTLPENVQAISVRKNGAPTEVNITDWSQLGNVITYNGVLEIGDYLIIGGVYVVAGSGGSSGGCITAECVESLPIFDNDLNASSLPNYTPYKTSTGEIRYKLPGTIPTSSEWIDEEEWIDEAEWID